MIRDTLIVFAEHSMREAVPPPKDPLTQGYIFIVYNRNPDIRFDF